MNYFRHYSEADLETFATKREGETRLWEAIKTGCIASFPGRFVLFGIPEDAGVRANQGIAGAATAWPSFLKAFLNRQDNDWLKAADLLLAGAFDFPDNIHVETIDEEVSALAGQIVAAGKMPIAIGGGHNNAYPMIRGVAQGLHDQGKMFM